MTQTWEHLLFAHWSVPVETIRSMVPSGLEIDTYDGRAWISIIPFLMSGVRIRRLPTVPFTSTFPEINVRTYVRANRKTGVYFLSLDASNPVVTAIARRWYRLMYFQANMSLQAKGDAIEFRSQRLQARPSAYRFFSRYQPLSEPFYAKKGTIEHWLTERYTLFCQCAKSTQIYFANVYHEPWKLQPVSVTITDNTMTQDMPIQLQENPEIVLYARGVQSIIWPIKRLNMAGG